ncbi:arylamine N-acetyltransferase, pineal gland isozyme NAT-3-like [Clavelina lepadiformis]|uniref:arylamine N-acetyltransferase, pineal gland isozyme NAT-3-like n=1 Tax=Clavelina lepadiformis TaxID=159417 RepID=UPI0040411341
MLKCPSFNIDTYLERIGYSGSKTPNLENLTKLCWCQATSVPHDTLDIFGGLRKTLNLDKIYNDIVTKYRGGFCYEQNGLFGVLLEALGYSLTLLEGSCFIYSIDQFSSRFDHLLFKVVIGDQAWIIDVGYGMPSFFEPMKFNVMTPQTQMTGIYRFRKGSDCDYYIEKKLKQTFSLNDGKELKRKFKHSKTYSIGDDWELICKFSNTPRQWKDFQVGLDHHLNDDNGFYTNNTFLEIFTERGVFVLWGTKLVEKEFISPMIEKIRCTEMLPENGDEEESKRRIVELMKKRFGVEVDFWPDFKSKNWSRLTFE